MEGETGYDALMTFMEKEFGEDEIYVYNKFEEFESFKKVSGQNMQQSVHIGIRADVQAGKEQRIPRVAAGVSYVQTDKEFRTY